MAVPRAKGSALVRGSLKVNGRVDGMAFRRNTNLLED
jgi:hypothetical protein